MCFVSMYLSTEFDVEKFCLVLDIDGLNKVRHRSRSWYRATLKKSAMIYRSAGETGNWQEAAGRRDGNRQCDLDWT